MLEVDGNSKETAGFVGRSAELMHSDHDKAEVLTAMSSPASEFPCGLLKAARTIQSDHDKARVLRESTYQDTPACRDAFFAVVSEIHADNDRSEVLRSMLNRTGLEAATYRRVAAAAAAMGSDNDKANVLKVLGSYYAEQPFFDAVNTVQSSNDRKGILQEIMQKNPGKAVLLGVVDSAAGVSSDNEKAEILIAVAKASNDADVRSAVQRKCEKIGSDSDYRRVASVLLRGGVESEQ
jgi:hypothetical protein